MDDIDNLTKVLNRMRIKSSNLEKEKEKSPELKAKVSKINKRISMHFRKFYKLLSEYVIFNCSSPGKLEDWKEICDGCYEMCGDVWQRKYERPLKEIQGHIDFRLDELENIVEEEEGEEGDDDEEKEEEEDDDENAFDNEEEEGEEDNEEEVEGDDEEDEDDDEEDEL